MGSVTAWLAGVSGLVASFLGLAAHGRAHWAKATRALLHQLEATRLPPGVARYETQELDGLPAPVQRYFGAVLKDGQRMITAVRVEH